MLRPSSLISCLVDETNFSSNRSDGHVISSVAHVKVLRILTAEHVAGEIRDVFDCIDDRLDDVGVGLDLTQDLLEGREWCAVCDAT